MKTSKSRQVAFRLTGDHALGLTGVGLAAASATFGIVMTLHGPAASFVESKDFTVFAQLAPRRTGDAERETPTGMGKSTTQELDTTPTASIAKPASRPDAGSDAIIPAVTLEAVGADSATVAIEGNTRVVHVGDEVPGAGLVIAILPGARPALKTSRGLIVPAAE